MTSINEYHYKVHELYEQPLHTAYAQLDTPSPSIYTLVYTDTLLLYILYIPLLKLTLPIVQVETRMNIKGHVAHYILGLYIRFQPLVPSLSMLKLIANSLHAGHWVHTINTWSCMSHHSGIVYAHMHNARLLPGVYCDCILESYSVTPTNTVGWYSGLH